MGLNIDLDLPFEDFICHDLPPCQGSRGLKQLKSELLLACKCTCTGRSQWFFNLVSSIYSLVKLYLSIWEVFFGLVGFVPGKPPEKITNKVWRMALWWRRLFLLSGPRDWMPPSDTVTMWRQKGAWKKLGGWAGCVGAIVWVGVMGAMGVMGVTGGSAL